MSSDYAATMPYAIRRAEAARRSSPTPAEVLQDEAPKFPSTPIYARKRKTSGLAGASPAALIGGGTVLVAAAAAVFALTWNSGSEPVAVRATPVDQPPAAAPLQQPAVNDPTVMAQAAETPAAPAAAEAQPIERAATPTPEPAPAKAVRTARVRPAPAAPSATDSAQDASAMLPDGPMPYVPDGTPTQPMTSQPGSPSITPNVSASTPPPVIVPQTTQPPAASATPPIDAAPDATVSDPASGPTP